MSDEEPKISPDSKKALGKKALLLQQLDLKGHPVTRCEDASGAPGYTGDLEADLATPTQKPKETRPMYNPLTDEWE